jgi:hypothetical protein
MNTGFELITADDCDGYNRHMKKEIKVAVQGIPLN